MKKLFGVFLILFMVVLCLGAREKTMRIGKFAWYTEQNTFKEIIEIARRENKPIFAVYSATWCKPCQAVKKEIFESEKFGNVAKEVVLLYVEQTDPKSKNYRERHRISFYPTFKLFSSGGRQYDMPGPDRSVEGFHTWVMNGKAGKYGFFQPGGKTMRIGDITWYTQETKWADILETARKANTPILVFVTGQRSKGLKIKKEILPAASVQEAIKGTTPLFINSRERSGRSMADKLKIMGYPAFLMVSKNGEEMDFKRDIESAEALIQWVNEVKAGKNIVGMKTKLKKDPGNRELLMEIIRKGRRLELDEQIDLTRKAIALKPDISDPSAQEAYENLLFLHVSKVRTIWNNKSLQEVYSKRHHAEYVKLLTAYYPDKFKHSMQLPSAYANIFVWFDAAGKHVECLKYADEYLKNEAPKQELRNKLMTLRAIFPILLNGGREKQAEELLEQLSKEVEKATDPLVKRAFPYIYSFLLDIFADFYGEKGDLDRAGVFAERQFADYTKTGMSARIEHKKEQFAMKYLLYAPELITQYESKLKGAEESKRYRWQLPLAAIYARKGEKQKARKYLDEVYGVFLKETDDEKRKKWASPLLQLARIAYDSDMVDSKILEIAKAAAALKESETAFDVLADIHAKLGNFKDAISSEEKAISLTKRTYKIPRYRFKIDMWKKK